MTLIVRGHVRLYLGGASTTRTRLCPNLHTGAPIPVSPTSDGPADQGGRRKINPRPPRKAKVQVARNVWRRYLSSLPAFAPRRSLPRARVLIGAYLVRRELNVKAGVSRFCSDRNADATTNQTALDVIAWSSPFDDEPAYLQTDDMNTHLALRSGNPALTADTFHSTRTGTSDEAMTVGGTVNKTALALLILLVTATYTWNAGAAGDPRVGTYTMLGVIGGFIVALLTIFKKKWAPISTPIYAALEGLALGGISVAFETAYPGIVSQAVFLTFGTLGALLLAYRSGLIRATENFKLGVVAATGGIMFVYLISFVLSFFGTSIPLVHGSGTFGILFSLFVVAIAALNLVLDFDFIEEGAERGAPKFMEWYAAFGLLVTLIWLYLEILRLLAKLQSRR